MKNLMEKSYFKWIIVGTSSFVFVLIVGFFGLKTYLHQKSVDRKKSEALENERRYEDKFRTAMTRIYQNLKLDHFLAAYKNLESVPPLRRDDASKIQEYLEALYRIGNGLLQSQLLKESESVFLTIREHEGQLTDANLALTKIEAKRRLDNSKTFTAQGDSLLAQKRYREANHEFEKAHLELKSIENLYITEIQAAWDNLKPKIAETKFHTLLDDAMHQVAESDKALKDKNYKELNQTLARAATTINRAAFLRPNAPEIKILRDRLIEIDAEMGYQIPNSFPLWNHFRLEDQSKATKFFYIRDYELNPTLSDDGFLRLKISYLLDPKEKFYIVRYRIHFSNGYDIFNGHFITPDPTKSAQELSSTVYLQEIPTAALKFDIQRIELKIYNDLDQIVSRIERAFRKPS